MRVQVSYFLARESLCNHVLLDSEENIEDQIAKRLGRPTRDITVWKVKPFVRD